MCAYVGGGGFGMKKKEQWNEKVIPRKYSDV